MFLINNLFLIPGPDLYDINILDSTFVIIFRMFIIMFVANYFIVF